MSAATEQTAAISPDPRPLRMWSADDEEFVIAYDAKDARDVFCELMGMTPRPDDDPDEDKDGTHPSHWDLVPDDSVNTLSTECEEDRHPDGETCKVAGCAKGLVRRTMTAGEWAKETGRGYWGGSNW